MEAVLEQADQLDGIVIETSGLALPEPLLQAFQWPEIRHRTRVSGVVTVVDGEALARGEVVADVNLLEQQRADDPSLDHDDSIDELFDEQLEQADLGSNKPRRSSVRRAATPWLPSSLSRVPTSLA